MARTKKQLQLSRAKFLEGDGVVLKEVRDDGAEDADDPVLLENKPTLRPKKAGPSLKDPDTDSNIENDTDEDSHSDSKSPKSVTLRKPPIRPIRRSRQRMSKEVITEASTKQPSKSRVHHTRPKNPRKKPAKINATKQAPANKCDYGTALEGDHYTVYDNAVVCKVAPCKNRFFKTATTFGNHVYKQHGLISTGTSRTLYALDSDEEERRQRNNAKRRKQPGEPVCNSYYVARGSMRKRWSQAKYRMRTSIFKRYVTKFEENRALHPGPLVPQEGLLITVLKYVMPVLGYHTWNSLLQPNDFDNLVDVIHQCDSTGVIAAWTDTVLEEIQDDSHSQLESKDLDALKSAATVLRTIFDTAANPTHSEAVTHALVTHRKNICQDAIRWIRSKKDNMRWETNHGWPMFEKTAEEEYQRWKIKTKPNSCKTTLPNLVRSYKAFMGCTEAEAKRQAAKDSVWIDTSDDDAGRIKENTRKSVPKRKSRSRSKKPAKENQDAGKKVPDGLDDYDAFEDDVAQMKEMTRESVPKPATRSRTKKPSKEVEEGEKNPIRPTLPLPQDNRSTEDVPGGGIPVFDECAPEWQLPDGPATTRFLQRLHEQEQEQLMYKQRRFEESAVPLPEETVNEGPLKWQPIGDDEDVFVSSGDDFAADNYVSDSEEPGDCIPPPSTIDDLTPTQVLFGHGSFGGITLSQDTDEAFTPSTKVEAQVWAFETDDSIKLGGDTIANVDECVDLGEPPFSPHDVEVGQEDDVFGALMGLCSLSQNPTMVVPGNGQKVSAVVDDEVQLSQDGLYADLVCNLGKMHTSQVPEYILQSQDESAVYRQSTPFIDLMCADSLLATQCAAIDKMISSFHRPTSEIGSCSYTAEPQSGVVLDLFPGSPSRITQSNDRAAEVGMHTDVPPLANSEVLLELRPPTENNATKSKQPKQVQSPLRMMYESFGRSLREVNNRLDLLTYNLPNVVDSNLEDLECRLGSRP